MIFSTETIAFKSQIRENQQPCTKKSG